MSCEQCRQRWSPYLDSELDAGTTFEVSEHLRTCAACRDRFEREAFIDDWLRTKLRRTTIPADLWASVCQKVRDDSKQKRAESRRLFNVRQPLAVAASIAMLVFAGVYYKITNPSAQRPQDRRVAREVVADDTTMAGLLQKAVPQLAAFRDAPDQNFDDHLDAICRKTLGVSVHINPSGTGGHPIELISVSERLDCKDKPYVEVRLNCCGQPMLLAFARIDCENGIEELCEPIAIRATKCRTGCHREVPAEVQSVARGEVMIAAVAVNHPVSSILDAIQVEPS
jgi:hypothetical protein